MTGPRAPQRQATAARRALSGGALSAGRWRILWERLWPALAALTTASDCSSRCPGSGCGSRCRRSAARSAGRLFCRARGGGAGAAVPGPRCRPRTRPAPARPQRGHPAPAGDRLADQMAPTRSDPFSTALWRAHRRARARRRARAQGRRAEARLAADDPYALRALVAHVRGRDILRPAASARAHHRGVRLAGRRAPANFRVDAWVTPPNYTGRPPMILPGLRPGEPRAGRGRPVPAGSILWCAPAARTNSTSRSTRRRSLKSRGRCRQRRPPARRSGASRSRDVACATVRGMAMT